MLLLATGDVGRTSARYAATLIPPRLAEAAGPTRCGSTSVERTSLVPTRRPFFDAHFHVIDSRFPLYENDGFLPKEGPGAAPNRLSKRH